MKKALLIIDLQNDFMPGGALPVRNGSEIIPLINQLMLHFDLVIATKDWHPKNHQSFASNHIGKNPGEIIDLNGQQQTLWPNHCVQGERGAELVHELDSDQIDDIILKGQNPNLDSYSTFFDNAHLKSTGLDKILKNQKIDSVYIVGVATDYCVKFSALDAIRLKYETSVITDACRGIDLVDGDVICAIAEMKAAGVNIILSDEIKPPHRSSPPRPLSPGLTGPTSSRSKMDPRVKPESDHAVGPQDNSVDEKYGKTIVSAQNSFLPHASKNAKIGIIGGSFNPPHLSHQLLALTMIATEAIEQLWIIPCGDHPFGKELESFSHRYKMCELAFSRLGNMIHVLDIENKLAKPNYSVLTLEAILKMRPDLKLLFALGSDSLAHIHKWHRADSLQKLADIIIFPRDGFPITTIPTELNKAKVHRGYVLPNISSTMIRQQKSIDTHANLLDQRVYQYILNNKLY